MNDGNDQRIFRQRVCRPGFFGRGIGTAGHAGYVYFNVYNETMRSLWDEAKRQANMSKHGLDFANAEMVFAGPLVLFEDGRAVTASNA